MFTLAGTHSPSTQCSYTLAEKPTEQQSKAVTHPKPLSYSRRPQAPVPSLCHANREAGVFWSDPESQSVNSCALLTPWADAKCPTPAVTLTGRRGAYLFSLITDPGC